MIYGKYVVIFNLTTISFLIIISSSRKLIDGILNSRKLIIIIRILAKICQAIDRGPLMSKNMSLDLVNIRKKLNKFQSIPDNLLDFIKSIYIVYNFSKNNQ